MNDIFPLRAPRLAYRILCGEAILMNPADSGLFNLNETATAIWLAADGRTSLRQIVEERLCADYEVGFETALADAEELARSLAEHAVLTLEPRPCP